MTSKVKNDFSEAHFDTISCFLSYAISIWQSSIWQSHGFAIWPCHMAKKHEMMSKWASEKSFFTFEVIPGVSFQN